MTFTDLLLQELPKLYALLNARLVLNVALLVGLGWLTRRALLSGTRVIWRLGWDRTRRLARLRSISDITLLVVLTLVVLRKLMMAAPVITWLSLAVVSLAVAIALPSWVRDIAAGIALSNRTRFREGDQVRLPTAVGSVRHIGLLRTAIRAGDGGTLSVPNRLVLAQTIQVGREQQAAPVDIVLPADAAASPEAREMLLRLAHVSPFRRAGSRPTLTESERGWVLAVQTWSTRDVDGARRALERQLLGSPGEENA